MRSVACRDTGRRLPATALVCQVGLTEGGLRLVRPFIRGMSAYDLLQDHRRGDMPPSWKHGEFDIVIERN
jgi:hypothetical protein